MISWHVAYARIHKSPEFKRFFGSAQAMPPHAFRYLGYVQTFQVAAGVTLPPANQNFPAGAIVLAITASAIQAQTTTGAFQYAPSQTFGRRDLFGLSFQYTNDELITPQGPALAEALLGGGSDTIFPGRELLIAPSQGILCTVQHRSVAPDLFVDVVYHSMVPRAVG